MTDEQIVKQVLEKHTYPTVDGCMSTENKIALFKEIERRFEGIPLAEACFILKHEATSFLEVRCKVNPQS